MRKPCHGKNQVQWMNLRRVDKTVDCDDQTRGRDSELQDTRSQDSPIPATRLRQDKEKNGRIFSDLLKTCLRNKAKYKCMYA